MSHDNVVQPYALILDHQVCYSLAVASRSVVSLYRPLLEPLGLTHPQYLVMVALWQGKPLSVKELGELLKLEPATLSPLLKRLEAAGLVERQRDPADERSLRLTPTPQGQALRQEVEKVPAAVAERLGMTWPELEALHQMLIRVVERTKELERADEQRPATVPIGQQRSAGEDH